MGIYDAGAIHANAPRKSPRSHDAQQFNALVTHPKSSIITQNKQWRPSRSIEITYTNSPGERTGIRSNKRTPR
jgi:hypothetical protein